MLDLFVARFPAYPSDAGAGKNDPDKISFMRQFHRKGQVFDLPWPPYEALGPEFFRFRYDRRGESPLSASGPIPALHSETSAGGTGSSNPACSSDESAANSIP
jgi:hypothetical protein